MNSTIEKKSIIARGESQSKRESWCAEDTRKPLKQCGGLQTSRCGCGCGCGCGLWPIWSDRTFKRLVQLAAPQHHTLIHEHSLASKFLPFLHRLILWFICKLYFVYPIQFTARCLHNLAKRQMRQWNLKN